MKRQRNILSPSGENTIDECDFASPSSTTPRSLTLVPDQRSLNSEICHSLSFGAISLPSLGNDDNTERTDVVTKEQQHGMNCSTTADECKRFGASFSLIMLLATAFAVANLGYSAQKTSSISTILTLRGADGSPAAGMERRQVSTRSNAGNGKEETGKKNVKTERGIVNRLAEEFYNSGLDDVDTLRQRINIGTKNLPQEKTAFHNSQTNGDMKSTSLTKAAQREFDPWGNDSEDGRAGVSDNGNEKKFATTGAGPGSAPHVAIGPNFLSLLQKFDQMSAEGQITFIEHLERQTEQPRQQSQDEQQPGRQQDAELLAEDTQKEVSPQDKSFKDENKNDAEAAAMKETSESRAAPVPLAITDPEVFGAEFGPETRGEGLSNCKESWDGRDSTVDVPLFWTVPQWGGNAILDIIEECHGLTVTLSSGEVNGYDELRVVTDTQEGNHETGRGDMRRYVNGVNTYTIHGMQRAKNQGLIASQLAEVIVTPFLFEANSLLDETEHNGRIFTVLKHPVDRAIDTFYESNLHKETSLEEYANSLSVGDNWLTRYLSGNFREQLLHGDIEVAMEILRTKVLVGLEGDARGTMGRFERYFEWRYKFHPSNQEACRERMLDVERKKLQQRAEGKTWHVHPGSPVYDALASHNMYDMQLYAYAETLFREQEHFVLDVIDDVRKVDASCCQCDDPSSC